MYNMYTYTQREREEEREQARNYFVFPTRKCGRRGREREREGVCVRERGRCEPSLPGGMVYSLASREKNL